MESLSFDAAQQGTYHKRAARVNPLRQRHTAVVCPTLPEGVKVSCTIQDIQAHLLDVCVLNDWPALLQVYRCLATCTSSVSPSFENGAIVPWGVAVYG